MAWSVRCVGQQRTDDPPREVIRRRPVDEDDRRTRPQREDRDRRPVGRRDDATDPAAGKARRSAIAVDAEAGRRSVEHQVAPARAASRAGTSRGRRRRPGRASASAFAPPATLTSTSWAAVTMDGERHPFDRRAVDVGRRRHGLGQVVASNTASREHRQEVAVGPTPSHMRSRTRAAVGIRRGPMARARRHSAPHTMAALGRPRALRRLGSGGPARTQRSSIPCLRWPGGRSTGARSTARDRAGPSDRRPTRRGRESRPRCLAERWQRRAAIERDRAVDPRSSPNATPPGGDRPGEAVGDLAGGGPRDRVRVRYHDEPRLAIHLAISSALNAAAMRIDSTARGRAHRPRSPRRAGRRRSSAAP